MKKRILSILLTLCMVLMLVPTTAFAETPSERYSLTLKFKYGTLYGETGSYDLGSDYKADDAYNIFNALCDITGYEPYKIVGVRSDTGDGDSGTFVDHDIVLEVVYAVDGSLAITVDGFEVGKTPADCTYTVKSTIPGVSFSADDMGVPVWYQFVYDGEEGYIWSERGNNHVFMADTEYLVVFHLNNNGLELAPTVTVNGKTPDECSLATRDGVPYALGIRCKLGTPPAPTPTITINGPDVVCAQQDYEFTATPSEGVTLDEKFGHDSGYSGSDIELTIDEDGVGHGVVPAAYYVPAANGFDVNAHGTTANGTPVSATKTVQVSPEHIYVDGVCGCGAVLQYTVEYIGSGDDPICRDIKTYGQDLTLRGETFTMDGYVQTGWVDKETGAIYRLGDTYTEDADVTLNPVFEKLITLTVPYTTTVALGDVGVPGEKTFTLALIGDSAPDKDKSNVTVSGSVTTNGKGSYNGTLTITGPEETLWVMLSEGAFVQQVDNGEAGWTVDDTVWGVLMEEIPVAYAMGDDAVASEYTVRILPASCKGTGEDVYYDLDWNATPLERMSFTNTYTKSATEPTNPVNPTEPSDPTDPSKPTDPSNPTDPSKPTGSNPNTGALDKVPQTGDNSNLTFWFALLAVSAAGVIGTGVYIKRRKNAAK